MLVRISKFLGVVAIASALSISAWGQAAAPAAGTAPAGKQVKDKAEYDLFTTATTEQNAQKRLDALNQWLKQYPESDYKKERLLIFLSTYQQLNKIDDMIDTANKILALDPKDFTSMYWLATLALSKGAANDVSPANLDRAEKAGQGMLANLDETFADAKRPATTDAAVWTKTKNEMTSLAHKALGWENMVKKNYDPAETELRKSLEVNPAQGEVIYWLGQTLYSSKKSLPEGLFYYARAATYDGPGALPPAGRTQIDGFVTRAYKGYHGDLKGLDELKALAKTNATPPAGFTIKSVTEIAKENIENENKAAAADPAGALWKRIKDELTGPNGATYFDSSMKDAALPELRGKVVSQSPATKPKEITVAMGDSTDAEVTLKLAEGTMPGKAEPGTEIHFTAIPKSYTASPLMVVMEVEKPSNIKGWPAAAAAPRPARPRPGAGKKK